MKSVLTKNQKKKFTKINVLWQGEKVDIIATLRYDDECGNGHNTLSVTGEIYKTGKRSDRAMISCGCIHDAVSKHFPELKHAIQYHLVSSDGPMHYIANTLYNASDKDCWGYRKGQACRWSTRIKFGDFPMLFDVDSAMLRMIESRPNWSKIKIQEHKHQKDPKTYGSKFRFSHYIKFCKTKHNDAWYNCSHNDKAKIEAFLECCRKYPIEIVKTPTEYSQGKIPDLKAARNCAIWPEAKLSDLTEENLNKRLPKIIKKLKKIVESFNMVF